MAKKNKIKLKNVGSGSQEIENFDIVPDGETWVIKELGAIDVNNGDNKSSLYTLQYGADTEWETIITISVTGSTYKEKILCEVVGNGVKHLRVVMENNSNKDKDMVFWLKAHSRS